MDDVHMVAVVVVYDGVRWCDCSGSVCDAVGRANWLFDLVRTRTFSSTRLRSPSVRMLAYMCAIHACVLMLAGCRCCCLDAVAYAGFE